MGKKRNRRNKRQLEKYDVISVVWNYDAIDDVYWCELGNMKFMAHDRCPGQ